MFKPTPTPVPDPTPTADPDMLNHTSAGRILLLLVVGVAVILFVRAIAHTLTGGSK